MADNDNFEDVELPPSEDEMIKKQRKQFMLFAIAGLLMLVLAFFAGRTVKGWVSDDATPVGTTTTIEVLIDEA